MCVFYKNAMVIGCDQTHKQTRTKLGGVFLTSYCLPSPVFIYIAIAI